MGHSGILQNFLLRLANGNDWHQPSEFLVRHQALEAGRIRAVETGGCPHAAIREDISANLLALEDLHRNFHPDILLLESGGDNLAACFSRELADYTIQVIDVAGGDKIPRKGGPGITQSDLLVINKTDLAEVVGADLNVMAWDARRMRGDGPFVFAQVRHGVGVEDVVRHVVRARRRSGDSRPARTEVTHCIVNHKAGRVAPCAPEAVTEGARTE